MDISDQASIMSHMTRQKVWLHWADEEAEWEAEKFNVRKPQEESF
jgi:hypothetical protein